MVVTRDGDNFYSYCSLVFYLQEFYTFRGEVRSLFFPSIFSPIHICQGMLVYRLGGFVVICEGT